MFPMDSVQAGPQGNRIFRSPRILRSLFLLRAVRSQLWNTPMGHRPLIFSTSKAEMVPAHTLSLIPLISLSLCGGQRGAHHVSFTAQAQSTKPQCVTSSLSWIKPASTLQPHDPHCAGPSPSATCHL